MIFFALGGSLLKGKKSMDGFLMRLHLHDTRAFTLPTFVGRSSELAQLAEWLVFEEHPAVKTVTLTGMAGIGKTQLVYAYFAAHSFKYRAIIWCDATSEQTYLADVRSTLEHIGLPQPASDSSCVDQLYIWLQADTTWPWLLVLDNYSGGSSLIERLLAIRAPGHAIITTRRQAVRAEHPLQLQEMSLEESSVLLLRRAHLLAPDATFDTVPSDLAAQAKEIVRVVGGLPFALDQVGAYRAETQESLASCLTLLQRSPLTLFSRRGTLADTGESHPEPIVSTYSHQFDELSRLHPLSLDLLHVLAFLPADKLQEDVLRSGASALDDRLATCLSDTLAFNEAIADLRKHSLIEQQITLGGRILHMHPVVRLLLQESPLPEQHRALIRQVERLSASQEVAKGKELVE